MRHVRIVGDDLHSFLTRNQIGLIFIKGSLITMKVTVKIFKEITSWSLHSVIILPCFPGYTFSSFDVSFSYQIECAILSSPGRAVCESIVTCVGSERHVTNTTTLNMVITSVLFVNYT
jgi:hypothetical protein